MTLHVDPGTDYTCVIDHDHRQADWFTGPLDQQADRIAEMAGERPVTVQVEGVGMTLFWLLRARLGGRAHPVMLAPVR